MDGKLRTLITGCFNNLTYHMKIGNVQIGNVQIGNDKIRNVEIGRMEWPFSATVETASLHTAIKWEARLVTAVGRFRK